MTATFHVGDAIEVMGKLPEASVDLVLSSPPFLALRSYLPADHESKALEGGSQATPGEYVDWLLNVVEACARVLAPHGSLCFELGDTYSGSGGAGGDYGPDGLREGQPAFTGSGRLANYTDERGNPDGMRDTTFSGGNTRTGGGQGWPLAKSLSLIPESFRWAMVYGHNPHTGRRTEPWRLRNVIRWVRPNPPVGALGDKFRPATSELMVFCKTKDRYFDLDAVREPHKDPSREAYGFRVTQGLAANPSRGDYEQNVGQPMGGSNPAGAPPLDWWNIPLLEGEEPTKGGPKEKSPIEKPRPRQSEPSMARGGNWDTFPNVRMEGGGAPPLDWWNIPPGGYPGAHYAVWPPELLVKPIKAMCPESVCRRCGEPRRRIVGPTEYVSTVGGHVVLNMQEGERLAEGVNQWKGPQGRPGHYVASAPTLGFSDCGHDNWRPGVCLDPFAGSGTTLSVATGHGRDAIGIDLDERNYDLALDRVGPLILQRGTID